MNRYQTPVQNSLESYVPIPLEGIEKAASAVQGRYDTNEAADTAMNTTLANIRALDPDQEAVVKQMAGQYRTEALDLLHKHDGLYDDPAFKREQQGLLQKWSSDPRYAAVNATNTVLAEDAKTRAKEQEAGNEVYNINPSWKGVDAKGNFVVPTQGVARVTFGSRIREAAKDAGITEAADGTKTNEVPLASLKQQWLYGPEHAADREQAYQVLIQQGVPKEQARAAALQVIADKVDFHLKGSDREAAVARAARITKSTNLNPDHPTTEEGNSFEAINFKPDIFGYMGHNPTSLLSMGKVSHGRTIGMSAGDPIQGSKYIIGTGKNAGLGITPMEYTMGDKGGSQLPDQLMGVVQEGPMAGKMVAINRNNQSPEGVRSTAGAENVHVDPRTGYQYINYGTKDQAMIQATAMHVYEDKASGDHIYVPMNKSASIRNMGDNYSSDAAYDYSKVLKQEGVNKFKEDLRGLHMSVNDKGEDTDDFFKQWAGSTGAQRKELNRQIEYKKDHARPNIAGVPQLSVIDKMLFDEYGDAGKSTNYKNTDNRAPGHEGVMANTTLEQNQ